MPGDVLVAVDEQPIADGADLAAKIGSMALSRREPADVHNAISRAPRRTEWPCAQVRGC